MQNHILQLRLLSLVLIEVSLWALSLSQPPNLKVRTTVGKGKLEGSLVLREKNYFPFSSYAEALSYKTYELAMRSWDMY